MALVGKYKSYKHEVLDEMVTETVTLPDDIPEGHPDYELRGQTVEREYPKSIETETIYENCYIQIISFMFHKRMFTAEGLDDKKDECLDLYFRVYESEEKRRNDFNDFIYEEHLLAKQVEQEPGDDIRVLGYELLKAQRGLEEMENTDDLN